MHISRTAYAVQVIPADNMIGESLITEYMQVGSIGWKKSSTRTADPGKIRLQTALRAEAICMHGSILQLHLNKNCMMGSMRACLRHSRTVLKSRVFFSSVLAFLHCIIS